jgi:putative endonuclease
MAVTLYVIKSKINGRRYVGITSHLQRRLAERRRGGTKAGQVLGDFILVHTEEFPDHTQARQREAFLKGGQGRKWLDGLSRTARSV